VSGARLFESAGRSRTGERACVSPHLLHFFIDGIRGGRRFCAVPRELRLEYRRAFYHVMNHEDRREDTFRDDQDRKERV
jgi:hypothetical protein